MHSGSNIRRGEHTAADTQEAARTGAGAEAVARDDERVLRVLLQERVHDALLLQVCAQPFDVHLCVKAQSTAFHTNNAPRTKLVSTRGRAVEGEAGERISGEVRAHQNALVRVTARRNTSTNESTASHRQ